MNKIGLVGLGSIGKRHVANIRKLYPSCDLFVCSSSGRRYEDNINYHVVDNVQAIAAEEPDFVIISSPAPYHLEHISFFQRKNIPVLVEKPLASSMEDILSTPVNSNRLAVAYCLRYLPAARLLKTIIESAEYGKIYNIDACVGQFLPDWRKDKNYRDSVSASKKLGGGALLELSHEFDMLNYLSGDLVFQYAYLRTHQELGLDVEEIADVFLVSRNEILCRLHLDFIQKKAERKIKIIAQFATIVWDVIANRITANMANETRILYDEAGYDKNNMYLSMIKDFENLVYGKENTCVSMQEAAQIIEIIENVKDKGVWSN